MKDLSKVHTWRLERDLNLRPSGKKASTLPMCHYAPQIYVSRKANSTLGMIGRTMVTRDKDIKLRSYKSLARPQLEYCIQV